MRNWLIGVMIWLGFAVPALASSSVVFSRDTLVIESVVEIPVIRPKPEAETPVRDSQNSLSRNNIRGQQNEVLPTASPPKENVEEMVQTIRKHQFFITTRDAQSNINNWIYDASDVSGDSGVLYLFEQATATTIEPTSDDSAYDIVAIGSYGTINFIAKDIIPASLAEPIEIAKPVKALLYLEGGMTSTLGIKSGDRAINQLFPNAPTIEAE